jgi:RHS repeat-associated protein
MFARNGSAAMTNQNKYDFLNRLTGKSSALDFNYQYNSAGQRTRVTQSADGSYWVYGFVDVMGLALAGNTVTVNGTNAYQKWEYFREQVGTNNNSAPQWVGINVRAPQATNSGSVYLPQNPETNLYDLDGNETSDGHFICVWDAENRLVNLTSLTNAPAASKYKLDFTYDYAGRRIQKVVSTASGTNTNCFVYDGWNVVAILDGASTLLYSFTWGTDLSGSMQGAGGVGGLLSMTVNSGTNAGTYFYCYDGNGNVVALVNAANGSVAANWEYGPFGEVIRATGPMAKVNPFMFSTKFYDWESGLYYYGARYYNPLTGRWIGRDPAEEDEGGPNLYAFCGNDGINVFDFLGMEWIITRDGNPRAKAVATSLTDTFESLAIKAQLDISDIGFWLVQGIGSQAFSIPPGGMPSPCQVYTIPNTVYLNRDVSWPGWIAWALREKSALTKEGFFVNYSVEIYNADVIKQFADPNIWGFVNVAHGEKNPNQYGEIQTEDIRGLAPFMPGATPVHKLGGFKLVECYGNQMWRPIVSRYGVYWVFPGKLHVAQAPSHGFLH